MPSFAPRAATTMSQDSATSRPPATAKPSIAAISGLSAERWVMPAKPRPSTWGLSPLTNAFRSMPAQKPLPAPVRTPTRRSPSSSSSLERRGNPLRQRAVNGVARVRAVEGDQKYAPAALGENSLLVGHGD